LNCVKDLTQKNIVFMRSNVQWDILPVRFGNVERFECMKLLGVFTDSKLSLSNHFTVPM